MANNDPAADKPKRSRKKAKANGDQEAIPFVPPSNATETFLSMPEIFRHFLTYLDGKSLACMARVCKGWTYDVAAVLYNEVDSKQLSKMSHATKYSDAAKGFWGPQPGRADAKARRAIACNAVKSVRLRPGWCTDGMRAALLIDPSTMAHCRASDRHYNPYMVEVAIKTILKRFPNVRRLVADGRSAHSIGSRWTATFDQTGTIGHIDLLYDLLLYGNVPALDPPADFTISPLLVYVSPTYDRATPLVDLIGKSRYDIHELDWESCPSSDVCDFLKGMLDSGKAMSTLKTVRFHCGYESNPAAITNLIMSLRSAPQVRSLHMSTPLSTSVHPRATSIIEIPKILTSFATHNKELRDLSIGMSWDSGAEGAAYSWSRSPNQLKLERLFIRLSVLPWTRLFNLAAYVSCFMAPGGVLEFEWRKQNGKKATTHPLKEVVKEGNWRTASGVSVLGVYTEVVAAFHRLAARSPRRQLPASVDFEQYGVSTTRDIDHLTYDTSGSLVPIFESLVPRFLASCDYFVPTEDTPEALFAFVRNCLANADNMLKLHNIIKTLDKSINEADIAIIDGLSDLKDHVRKGGLKLYARLQKVEDDRVAAEKQAAEEAAAEAGAADLATVGIELKEGQGKRRGSVKQEQSSGSNAKVKTEPSTKAKPKKEAGNGKASKAKLKLKPKTSAQAKAKSTVRKAPAKQVAEGFTAGSYYVKDGWLVLDDDTDGESEYIPSSP